MSLAGYIGNSICWRFKHVLQKNTIFFRSKYPHVWEERPPHLGNSHLKLLDGSLPWEYAVIPCQGLSAEAGGVGRLSTLVKAAPRAYSFFCQPEDFAWLAWQPGYRLRAYRGRGRREVSCCKVQSVNCRDWTLAVLCSWEEWGCSSICKQGQRRAAEATAEAAARWRAACFQGE